MKREAGKVFLACAIGAGIGSLVALEMARAFWWIGLLVGGLAGYLSYEWRAVLRAIPAAYRAARGWHPPRGYWQSIRLFFVLISAIVLWCSALLFVSVVDEVPPEQLTHNLVNLAWGVAGMFTAGLLLVIGFAIAYRNVTPDENYLSAMRKANFWMFPPIVLFWHLPRGIWWVARRLPRAMALTIVGIARGIVAFIRFMKRFIWQLFLRIHSEMRLLCGIDAMLGAAVGYFAGSAIIGALAGGLFGVLNYAVVTERWLKPKGYLPVR